MKWTLVAAPVLALCSFAAVAIAANPPCLPHDAQCRAFEHMADRMHFRIGGQAAPPPREFLHRRQGPSTGKGGGGPTTTRNDNPPTPPTDPPTTNDPGPTQDPPTQPPPTPPPSNDDDTKTTQPPPSQPQSPVVTAAPETQTSVNEAGQTVTVIVTKPRPNTGPATTPPSPASPSPSNPGGAAKTGDNVNTADKGISTGTIVGIAVAGAAIVLAALGIFMFRKLGLKPSKRFRGRLADLGMPGLGPSAAPSAAGSAAATLTHSETTATATPEPRDKRFIHDTLHDNLHMTSPSPVPSQPDPHLAYAGYTYGAPGPQQQQHAYPAYDHHAYGHPAPGPNIYAAEAAYAPYGDAAYGVYDPAVSHPAAHPAAANRY